MGEDNREEQWTEWSKEGLIMKYSNRKRVQNNEPQRGEDQPAVIMSVLGAGFVEWGLYFRCTKFFKSKSWKATAAECSSRSP